MLPSEQVLVTNYLNKPFAYPADSLIGSGIACGHQWNPLFPRLAAAVLAQDRPLIVDVGANLGGSLLQILSARSDARAIAIEPSDRYRPLLRRNLDSAGFPDVQIVPFLVGKRRGSAWLHNNTTSASVVRSDYSGFVCRSHQLVHMTTLDDLLKTRVDFMKLDTDGYDLEALRGAERILRTHRPALLFELEPRLLALPAVADLTWLQSLDYRRFICLTSGGRYLGTTADPAVAVSWATDSISGGYCDLVACAAETDAETRLAQTALHDEA